MVKEWHQYTKEERNQSFGCLAIMMLIMLGGCWVFSGSDSTTSNTKQQRPNHSIEMAFVMSQEFVMERLKTSYSAKFPYKPIESNRLQGNRIGYRILSYVDAQNEFGAMIRSTYECKMYFDPIDSGWTCEGLRINER